MVDYVEVVVRNQQISISLRTSLRYVQCSFPKGYRTLKRTISRVITDLGEERKMSVDFIFPQTVWRIETQFDRIHTLILTSKSTDIKSGSPLRISFPIYRMKAGGRETTSDEHFLQTLTVGCQGVGYRGRYKVFAIYTSLYRKRLQMLTSGNHAREK